MTRTPAISLPAFTIAVILATSAPAVAETITVSPNGVDDTVEIQAAFDACVASGPDCTVQLAAGTFKTSLIEVEGFDGFFKGAGKGWTIVTNVPRLPCQGLIQNGSWPSLFKFRGGNINVSDLSFHITGQKPCATWSRPQWGSRVYLGAIVHITG
ncbi:MAG: hypothetical protein V3U98_10335, partial [Acidobacteriota bacterium]